MFGLSHNHKVIWPIIGFYPVNVVDYFRSLEVSSKHLFCDKTMFGNIKIWLSGKRMVSTKNKSVSGAINVCSASPSMAVFTTFLVFSLAKIVAIKNVFVACYKKLATVDALFFIVNLRPRPTLPMEGPVPDTGSRMNPVFSLNVFNFHDNIVSQFIGLAQ